MESNNNQNKDNNQQQQPQNPNGVGKTDNLDLKRD